MRDSEDINQLQPQYQQTDTIPGVFKATVVDVRDPMRRGQIKVHAYGLQGDFKDLDIAHLDWIEPMHGLRGSFSPPALGERVLVSADSGDKGQMLYMGTWRAVPVGDGLHPAGKRKGDETRPEGFANHNLVPESLIIASTGEGDTVWMSDLVLNEKHIISSINLMDSGGKYFKIQSVHADVENSYCPVDKFPTGKGSMHKQDFGDYDPKRTGFETPDSLENTAGIICFGVMRAKRELLCDKEDFSLDRFTQKIDQDEITRDEVSLAGVLFQTRLAQAKQVMLDNMMSLMAPNGIFINDLLTPPRVWDDSQDSNSNNEVTV